MVQASLVDCEAANPTPRRRELVGRHCSDPYLRWNLFRYWPRREEVLSNRPSDCQNFFEIAATVDQRCQTHPPNRPWFHWGPGKVLRGAEGQNEKRREVVVELPATGRSLNCDN